MKKLANILLSVTVIAFIAVTVAQRVLINRLEKENSELKAKLAPTSREEVQKSVRELALVAYKLPDTESKSAGVILMGLSGCLKLDREATQEMSEAVMPFLKEQSKKLKSEMEDGRKKGIGLGSS